MLTVGLLLLPAACDITPDIRSGGKKVAIRFSANTINEEGGEEVLRSAGVGEADTQTQTQTMLLDSDLFLYATLKPDSTGAADELRAAIPLAEGQKVCLVACGSVETSPDNWEYKQVATATYTCTAGQLVADEGQPLEVELGGTYDFTAYSYYNSSETPLASDIDPAKDLVWGRQTKEITDNDRTITIHMTHQFSQVRVRVKTNMAGAAITDLEDVEIVSHNFGLNDHGNISWGADLSLPVTFPDFESTTEITGNETYMVYPTVYGYSMYGQTIYPSVWVNIGSITVSMGTANPFTGNNLSIQYKLTGGKRYMLEMELKQSRWAFSNIYWQAVADENNPRYPGYLTFDTQNKGNQNYQGVMFRWGSLVGIAPPGQGDFSTTPVYIPNYVEGGTSTWSVPETSPYSTMDDISWANDGNYDFAYLGKAEQNTPEKYAAKKGDICQYLGKTDPALEGYYMPTHDWYANDLSLSDFRAPSQMMWLEDTEWKIISIYPHDYTYSADGKARRSFGIFHQEMGLVLPFSGAWSEWGGGAGAIAYWTTGWIPDYFGTPLMLGLLFDGYEWRGMIDVFGTGGFYYEVATPVRCIRKLPEDL
jgi:hypothetical protein